MRRRLDPRWLSVVLATSLAACVGGESVAGGCSGGGASDYAGVLAVALGVGFILCRRRRSSR